MAAAESARDEADQLLSEANRRYEDLLNAVKSLEDELQKATGDNEKLQSRELELDGARIHMRDLEAQVQALEAAAAKNRNTTERLETFVETLQQEKHGLEEELENASESEQQLREAWIKEQEDHDDTKGRLEEQMTNAGNSSQMMDTLNTQYEQNGRLQAELNELRPRLQQMEAELATLRADRAEYEAVKAELTTLRAERTSLASLHQAELAREASLHQAELDAMKAENANYEP